MTREKKSLSCEVVMIVGTKATGTKGTYGQGTKDRKEMKVQTEVTRDASWRALEQ